MTRMCERPGCSEPGSLAYGMVPEDLLFWIAKLVDAPTDDPNVLCRRHADAMVVPRGWTLDDRREDTLRLFRPKPPSARSTPAPAPAPTPRRTRPRVDRAHRPEQLQIDGTGETARPHVAAVALDEAPVVTEVARPVAGWQPDFDATDDLNGLLQVSSPLLARAFRGTDRRKG